MGEAENSSPRTGHAPYAKAPNFRPKACGFVVDFGKIEISPFLPLTGVVYCFCDTTLYF